MSPTLCLNKAALPPLTLKRTSRTQLAVTAEQAKPVLCRQKAMAASVGMSMLAASSSLAANPVVQELAKNEPFLVTVFWTAMFSTFTLSISFVVWGRNGL